MASAPLKVAFTPPEAASAPPGVASAPLRLSAKELKSDRRAKFQRTTKTTTRNIDVQKEIKKHKIHVNKRLLLRLESLLATPTTDERSPCKSKPEQTQHSESMQLAQKVIRLVLHVTGLVAVAVFINFSWTSRVSSVFSIVQTVLRTV